jgi:hypothetical protein
MAIDPQILKKLEEDLNNIDSIINDISKQIGNSLNPKLASTSEELKNILGSFEKGENITKKLESNLKKAIQENRKLGLDQNKTQAELSDALVKLNQKYTTRNKKAVENLRTELQSIRAQQRLNEEVIDYLRNLDNINQKIVETERRRAELARKIKEERKKEWGFMGLMNKLGVSSLLTFASILEAAFKAQKQIAELGRSLGISRNEADRLRNGMQEFANSQRSTFVTVERLVKAQAGLTEQLGIAVDFGNEERETFARLTELTGLAAEEAGKLARFSAVTGVTTRKYVSDLRVAAVEAYKANRIHISDKELLSSVARLSAGILVKFQGNPKALAEAVVQAKALGTSLEQVDKIGDSLLDWQSSIQNELEAELITNRKLNFEAARYAALTGDQSTVMKEMVKQAGSLAEFENLNVIARESLAKAFGVNKDEMAEMLMKQEAINKYGDAASQLNAEQLKDMEKKNMSAAEYLEMVENQRSAQEKFNDAILKLQEMLGTLLEGPIGAILNSFTTLLSLVEKIGSSLGGLTGILLGLIPVLLRGSAIMRVFAIKGFQSGVAAIFQSFAKVPFGLGIPLAIAAVAGLSRLFDSKGTADDAMFPSGYGDRVLFDEGSIIGLNNNDNLYATTNTLKPSNGGGGGGNNPELLRQQQRTNELLEQSLNRTSIAVIQG